MAVVTEIVVAIEAAGVEKVMTALKQVEGAQVKLTESTKKAGTASSNLGRDGGNALVEFGKKWQGMVGMVTTAALPAMAVIGGIKKAVDFSQAGASLDYLGDKFSRLTRSIGADPASMMDDLRTAMRGVKSESEMMAGAVDLLSLGLTKTSDETVRLAAVAGALNMDMSQLVLTITNKSTMRLDQLGLSASRVTAKFEELKAAGWGEDAAWLEALISAGEAAIGTMGHVADSAVSDWARMKASQTDYFDSMKIGASETMSWWPRFWNGLFEEANRNRRGESDIDLYRRVGLLSPQELGRLEAEYKTRFSSDSMFRGGQMFGAGDLMAANEQYFANLEDKWRRISESYAWRGSAEGAGFGGISVGFTGVAEEIDLATSSLEGFISEFENITSLTTNFGGVVKLATQYDDILGNIADLQGQRTALINQGYSEQSQAVKNIDEQISGLRATMAGLANQMTLDMFQATIAIGGVTEAEAEAYFNMAAEMGLISKEAADAAIAAYKDAVDKINGMKIDKKTGEVTMNAASAIETLEWLQAYTLLDKTMRIWVKQQLVTAEPTQNWADSNYDFGGPSQAIGGPVYPNTFYRWQEPNREGELFIPEKYGRVMSNHEVAMAMREALMGGNFVRGATHQEQQVITNDNRQVNINVERVDNEVDMQKLAFMISEEMRR